MRRPWLLATLGLAALALGGWLAFRWLTHESSTPTSVTAAIARFRALSSSARMLPPGLSGRAPEPGVYVYDTRGSEVSHVLGTRRHPYPSHTTITASFTPHGCLRTRWNVLATRWDGVLACPRPDGSWRLLNQSEEHEFAGHVDRRTYACTPASTYRPVHLTTGARWSSRCAIEGTMTVDRSSVLDARMLMLDGRPLRTLLVRTVTRVSGDTVGAGTTFSLLEPDTGLAVRRMIANASTTDTIAGDARYQERATLALTQPRPRR